MIIDELRKHLFIVIGYEHYNPLGVIRSLGERGIYPVVIILRSEIKYASASRYIRKLYYVDDYKEAFRIIMKKYSHMEKKPFIIPCDDNITELLDKKYDKIKDIFYFSNAGEPGRITKYQDKSVISLLAEKCGMQIPKIWHVNIQNREIPSDIVYPVITKPETSYPNWKSDYYICNNSDELLDAYNKIHGGPILLQRYIKKKNEYSVDGIVWNHGKNVFISVETLYTYILPDYYSMEMVHSTFKNSEIQLFLNKMFREIKYEGIFSIDVLIDENDEKWFLEINLRNSAWSYASTKLGMNLPLLWAQGMLTGKIDKNARKRVPKNYVALAEVNDFEQRVMKHHYISAFTWLKGMIKADCLYVWNWKDPKPFFSVVSKKIMHKIKRRSGK